jgi:hypothetical protein
VLSCAASAAWSHPVLLHCCTEHGQRCGVALSGHITTIAVSKSGQLGQRCTVAACPHILRAMMAQVLGISVMCGHALETRESNRIGRPAKAFFILKVWDPQRAAGHVAASEPSRAGRRVQCRGTRGSAGALSSREAGSGAARHVTAPEPFRIGRQNSELWDTWQRQSPTE